MEASVFKVEGMTCQACVKTVSEKLTGIPGVALVNVDLSSSSAKIIANRKIDESEVKAALAALPKYKVGDSSAEIEKQSFLKTYKPLITVFSFILLVSLAFQFGLGTFDRHLFMNHLMGGFFIGFSFFKFLDLKAFAESFSSYDPIAQRWAPYGSVYPFIELILGLFFIASQNLLAANAVTILILSMTTYGVYMRLQSKNKIQCACLGTTFSLPLSNITIAENVAMITMAIFNLSIF